MATCLEKPTDDDLSPERRLRILHRANHEFLTCGFEGANLENIANAAGVSKVTIYRYFKDKHDLFEQVVLDAAANMAAPLAQCLQQPGTMTDVLQRYGCVYVARMLKGVSGSRPFYEMARILVGASLKHGQLIRNCRTIFERDIRVPLATYFAERIAAGDLRDEGANFLADYFVRQLFFTNAAAIAPEDIVPEHAIADYVDRSVRMFLSGCGTGMAGERG